MELCENLETNRATKIGVDTKNILEYKSTQIVEYAEYVNIMGRSQKLAAELLVKLDKAGMDVGLKINETKIKAVIQSKQRRNQCEKI